MINYQSLVVKFATFLAIALIDFGLAFPGIAMTQNIQINSTKGYRVETSFSYDENQNQGIISEQPGGETNIVNSLKVRFYDPADKMIASYDNIVDGKIQGKYFEFNYDPENQRLLGKIDLGGESAGEIYLKGDVAQGLSLVVVEASGEERTIDQLVIGK